MSTIYKESVNKISYFKKTSDVEIENDDLSSNNFSIGDNEADQEAVFNEERDSVYFADKEESHFFKKYFDEAKEKCQTSVFNFGIYLKESLKSFSMSSHIKKMGT